MSPFATDLEQAHALGWAVELVTIAGEKRLTGIVDLNVEENWLRIKDPQNLGDNWTTKTLLLSDISSLTLLPDVKG